MARIFLCLAAAVFVLANSGRCALVSKNNHPATIPTLKSSISGRQTGSMCEIGRQSEQVFDSVKTGFMVSNYSLCSI